MNLSSSSYVPQAGISRRHVVRSLGKAHTVAQLLARSIHVSQPTLMPSAHSIASAGWGWTDGGDV
jgi:hypothetical protein